MRLSIQRPTINTKNENPNRESHYFISKTKTKNPHHASCQTKNPHNTTPNKTHIMRHIHPILTRNNTLIPHNTNVQILGRIFKFAVPVLIGVNPHAVVHAGNFVVAVLVDLVHTIFYLFEISPYTRVDELLEEGSFGGGF